MKSDKCDFSQAGLCAVADEFPEMNAKPCQYNKNNKCTAKPEDLISICPDCGDDHCSGECQDIEETLMVPKSNKVK
jgi:hypothetical protein